MDFRLVDREEVEDICKNGFGVLYVTDDDDKYITWMDDILGTNLCLSMNYIRNNSYQINPLTNRPIPFSIRLFVQNYQDTGNGGGMPEFDDNESLTSEEGTLGGEYDH